MAGRNPLKLVQFRVVGGGIFVSQHVLGGGLCKSCPDVSVTLIMKTQSTLNFVSI